MTDITKKDPIPITTDPMDEVHLRTAIHQSTLCTPTSGYSVGAVLLSSTGDVLSTGYSRELPNNTHAEECCLLKLSDLSLARGGTIYTTMEPCSKRLSGNKPCSEWIIDVGISRVVMGVREPPIFVNCIGVEWLKEKGIIVEAIPALDEECLKASRHMLDKN